MKEREFYICEKCGNIVAKIYDAGVPLVCCGVEMKKLEANTVDAANEKHVPVIVADGNKVTVKVGEVAHPMTEAHLITWVYIQTKKGGQRFDLVANDEPKAEFLLVDGDELFAAYAYCNLHGLWKANA